MLNPIIIFDAMNKQSPTGDPTTMHYTGGTAQISYRLAMSPEDDQFIEVADGWEYEIRPGGIFDSEQKWTAIDQKPADARDVHAESNGIGGKNEDLSSHRWLGHPKSTAIRDTVDMQNKDYFDVRTVVDSSYSLPQVGGTTVRYIGGYVQLQTFETATPETIYNYFLPSFADMTFTYHGNELEASLNMEQRVQLTIEQKGSISISSEDLKSKCVDLSSGGAKINSMWGRGYKPRYEDGSLEEWSQASIYNGSDNDTDGFPFTGWLDNQSNPMAVWRYLGGVNEERIQARNSLGSAIAEVNEYGDRGYHWRAKIDVTGDGLAGLWVKMYIKDTHLYRDGSDSKNSDSTLRVTDKYGAHETMSVYWNYDSE